MTQRDNILEELKGLGSTLATMHPENPYVVPGGYFEGLLPNILQKIKALDTNDAKKEIEALSPLLAGLKKEMPQHVPDGYFERSANTPVTEAKLISMNPRKWFRYAAAVVTIGLLITTGLVIWRNNDVEKMSISKLDKTLSREIGKMSDVELAEFLQYTDAGLNGEEKVNVTADKEVKKMLEDIPVTELKEFIEETSDLEAEEVLMN